MSERDNIKKDITIHLSFVDLGDVGVRLSQCVHARLKLFGFIQYWTPASYTKEIVNSTLFLVCEVREMLLIYRTVESILRARVRGLEVK